jgi:transposase
VTTATKPAPHHNKLTCYTDYSCRLPECVERKRLYQVELRRKKRDGEPPLIDAGPVREHVLRLQADGVNIYSIAAVAGVDEWTIRSLFPSPSRGRGRKNSVSPETARKILAVNADQAMPGYTDGTGTRRRIQAMVAKGWPMRRVAARFGIHPTYAADLILRRQSGHLIYTATAEKVAAAYEQLKAKQPARCGVPAHLIRQSRERAKANRWAPPSYWDKFPGAIDDPHFTPMYGVTRCELIAEDGLELEGQGYTREQAAERLGISRDYLQQCISAQRTREAA